MIWTNWYVPLSCRELAQSERARPRRAAPAHPDFFPEKQGSLHAMKSMVEEPADADDQTTTYDVDVGKLSIDDALARF